MSESDIESVISEDIAYASDGSEDYDPTAYHDDFEDSYAVEITKSLPPPPAPKPTNAAIVSKPSIYSSALPETNVNKIKALATSGTLKPKEESVEYSVVFEDDFEQESIDRTNYSNDFEDDYEDINKSHQQQPSMSQKQPFRQSSATASVSSRHMLSTTDAATSSSATTMSLPALLNIQAVQAELAIDEISQEVLRLRNRQKALLRERKIAAKDKKQRAEMRRHHYQQEMKLLSDRANDAEKLLESLNAQIQLLSSQLQRSADNCSSGQLALDVEKQVNAALRVTQNSLHGVIAAKDEEIKTLQASMRDATERWTTTVDQLRMQVQKAELMTSVLQRSTEANEER